MEPGRVTVKEASLLLALVCFVLVFCLESLFSFYLFTYFSIVVLLNCFCFPMFVFSNSLDGLDFF